MQIDDFLRGKYKPREAFVPLPAMCGLCRVEGRDNGGEACKGLETPCAFLHPENGIGVTVRGLDGLEHAKIQASGQKELHKIAYALLSADGANSTAKAVQEYLGVTGAPPELEQQICFLQSGIIWPEFKSDEKVRFAAYLNKYLRAEFLTVYKKIGELTGEGACPEG